MPKVDGFQILKWIRSQPHLAPMVVVTLTGEMDPKRLALAYQLGANSYLAKDGSVAEYREFVRFFTSYAAITKRDIVDNHSTAIPMPFDEASPEDNTEADGRSEAGAA
jgi:CheY-like chemotaxis protein